jgi:hypothetical protein
MLQGGIKTLIDGNLETTPQGVVEAALNHYGVGDIYDAINSNQHLFSMFMGTMIMLGQNDRVDMTPWAHNDTATAYDEHIYSNCVEELPSYEFIRGRLVEMGYINGSLLSGLRFNDAVLTGGVNHQYIYDVNLPNNDQAQLAYCLNQDHLAGILDTHAVTSCPIIPCTITCEVFNDYILDFNLCL